MSLDEKITCRGCGETYLWNLRDILPPPCPKCGKEWKEQTIELDCPPGHPRPGDLIDYVIAGTGLPKRETVSRVFGNWKWDYNDIPEEKWKEIQPILGERIRNLYEKGIIRYGSW